MNADHPAPEPLLSTLAERVRGVLEAAEAPLEFSKIKTAVQKLYPKGTKKAPQPPKPTEAEILSILDGPGVHQYPPVKASGKLKYWHKPPPPPPDPVEVMRTTVAAKLEGLGDGPFPVSKLGKPTEKQGPEAARAFEKVIDELKSAKKLFELAGGKYAKKEPPTFKEIARETILSKLAALGDGPFTLKELGQPTGKAATPELLQAFKAVFEELTAAKKLFAHPGGLFGKKEPPTAEEIARGTVLSKLAALGDGPFTLKELGQPSGKAATPELLQGFKAVVEELIAEKKLFEHPGGKYGKKEPPKPKWYQQAPHKKEFESALKAARKLLDGNISADEILTALKEALGLSRSEHKPPPQPEKPEPQRIVPLPKDLRTALKEAYEYLCLFAEFRDRLVELRRLYPEAVKRMPDLTVEAFHRELWQMRQEWIIELHDLNEIHQAKDRHLAIERDDCLYYYARWK